MSSTYNRRQFLTHSAAAAGGVVAAGTLADQIVGSMPAGAAPVRGGTLTVGVFDEQSKPFNPDYAHMDTSGFLYARSIYDPLCVVSSNGKTVYPYLCESVTPNKGYNEWTIKARPNIKFHDGSPCNAAAIYANLQADLSSLLTGTAVHSLIDGFVLDAKADTVTVHTKYKWFTFPYTLAEQQIGFIAQPDTLADNASLNPVGTGPFIFNNWNYGTAFTTKANPSYWRGPGVIPYLNELVFMPNSDGQSRLNGLEDGTYDIIVEAGGQYIKDLKGLSKSSYTVLTDFPGNPVYSPSTNLIMMNCSKAPFNNINMRKGCATAINRALFVSVVEEGESVPVDGMFLPGSQYYKTPPYPKYSLKAAKALIAKVPKADRSFTLQWASPDPIVEATAEFVQAQLKLAGVTVTLSPVPTANLIDNALSGAYQAVTWSQFGGVIPELNYPWLSTKTGNFLFNLNFARNLDAKTQSLMLAGMAASTTTARKNAWASVNDQVDKDIPYMWLDRTVLGVAAHNNVQNWQTFKDPAGHAVLQPNQAVMFFTETWKS